MQQFAPQPGFDRTLVGVCSVARISGLAFEPAIISVASTYTPIIFILAERKKKRLWKSYRWASDGSLNFTASQSLISVRLSFATEWVRKKAPSRTSTVFSVVYIINSLWGGKGEKCPLRSLSYVVCSLCGLVFIRRKKCWLVFPRKYVSVTLSTTHNFRPILIPSSCVDILFIEKFPPRAVFFRQPMNYYE